MFNFILLKLSLAVFLVSAHVQDLTSLNYEHKFGQRTDGDHLLATISCDNKAKGHEFCSKGYTSFEETVTYVSVSMDHSDSVHLLGVGTKNISLTTCILERHLHKYSLQVYGKAGTVQPTVSDENENAPLYNQQNFGPSEDNFIIGIDCEKKKEHEFCSKGSMSLSETVTYVTILIKEKDYVNVTGVGTNTISLKTCPTAIHLLHYWVFLYGETAKQEEPINYIVHNYGLSDDPLLAVIDCDKTKEHEFCSKSSMSFNTIITSAVVLIRQEAEVELLGVGTKRISITTPNNDIDSLNYLLHVYGKE